MSEEFTCVALYGLFLMIPLLSSISQSLNLPSKLQPKAKTTAIPLKVSMYVKKVIEIRKGKQLELGSGRLGSLRSVQTIPCVK